MTAVASTSLPLAWKAAIAHCPFCSGTGKFTDEDDASCAHCQGTGDLIGALLADAYRCGRADALVKMREVYQVALLAGRQVSELPVPTDLKRSMGL